MLRSIIEHHALNTHNDPGRHWAGDHEVEHGSPLADRIKDAISLYETNESYIDVHAWYFTPYRFIDIMTTLFDMGITDLQIVECHASLRNDLEFFAVMKRN